jgi:hypothetical protein
MVRLMGLLAAMLLGACGDDSSNSLGSNVVPHQGADSPFMSGSVTGAVESDFQLAGVFKCGDPTGLGGPAVAEIIGTGMNQEQVVIVIPYSEGGVGTYSLIGTSDAPLTLTGRKEIRYRSTSRVTFDSGTGRLVISEWPAAGGERVKGTFEATLTHDDGTVELQGQISGVALSANFADCLR